MVHYHDTERNWSHVPGQLSAYRLIQDHEGNTDLTVDNSIGEHNSCGIILSQDRLKLFIADLQTYIIED